MVSDFDLAYRDFAIVGHETVSIDIVRIAVIVIVLARLAVKLGLVHPHIGGQVLVHIVHALVVDRDDNLRLAGLDGPGIEGVDVAAFSPLGLSAGILVMPLLGQPRIVERIGQVHRLDGGDELEDVDVVQAGDSLAGLCHRNGVIEDDVVP